MINVPWAFVIASPTPIRVCWMSYTAGAAVHTMVQVGSPRLRRLVKLVEPEPPHPVRDGLTAGGTTGVAALRLGPSWQQTDALASYDLAVREIGRKVKAGEMPVPDCMRSMRGGNGAGGAE